MTKADVTNFFKTLAKGVSKRSPEILTGIGVAGMITTTVLAVRATPKALTLIEDAKNEHENKWTPLDTVKVAWKPYIPAALLGVTSTVCLIGACSVSTRRTAAIATAYQLSETALSEYKDKVIETFGEKKEKIVREKIAEDHLEKNPVDDAQIIFTDKGSTLCCEPISGRYFKSDIDCMKRAVNNLNEKLLCDPFGYISLNDFCDELGLEPTSKGDDLGWNVSDGQIRLDFHAKIAKNGEPCIVIDYINPPVYDYNKVL